MSLRAFSLASGSSEDLFSSYHLRSSLVRFSWPAFLTFAVSASLRSLVWASVGTPPSTYPHQAGN